MERKPSPPALVRAFEEAVASLSGAERRKMFGSPAIFVNGNMFAGLVRDRLILRLGEADREEFLELPGATPFAAMGRPMKEWVVVPPGVLRSAPKLQRWLGKALAHGGSLPAKMARHDRDAR